MSTATATPSIADLQKQLAELKAKQKEVREAEKAKKAEQKAELEKTRSEVQGEIDEARKEYEEAKEALSAAKQKLAGAVAKLPKGVRGSGSGTSAWSTWSPLGGKLGLRPSAVAVLEVLSKKQGFLPVAGIRDKVAETGAKMHHSGQIYFEGPTLNGLVDAGLIEKKVIPSEELDGGRAERSFAITKKGRERLAQYKADAKNAERNGQ